VNGALKRQTRWALSVAFAALAFLVTTAPAAGAAPGGVYVALGDSYTSAPLVLNQTGRPIDCGRSDHNYPSLIAAELAPALLVDVSCGSAETKDMFAPQTGLPLGGTNPPQLDALRADATLVTVGIGGNDAGLVSVGVKCARLGLFDPFGTACRDFYAPGGNDTVQARIEATRPKIDAVLQGIHQRSPNARVAIVGYPNVLPLNGGSCYPLVPLSADDVSYIDSLIRRINAMIAEQAAKNDAEYVDTYTDSIGHDVCKLPPTRWFEGLIPTEPAYPLHPNGKGEASMARSALRVLSQPAPSTAPQISKLRVDPRRVRSGKKVRVRFTLDRAGPVLLVRLREGRTESGAGFKAVSPGPIAGVAGANRLLVRNRKLGRQPGRYLLRASTTADDGGTGEFASTRYRVVRKRR